VRAVRRPGAFLNQLARNRTIDRLRRHGRRDAELSPEVAATTPSRDDAIAAMLDASATATLVRAGLTAASGAKDHLTVRVITAWLDLADERDEPPNSREVAVRAEVSHTSVNTALKRFRDYLPRPDA
jgi:DNA-directed RNA polymerase specialized sigma24 family protein